MTGPSSTTNLINALATVHQLEVSKSHETDVPRDQEENILFACRITIQAAGVLLRLPQNVIAQAIVTFSRFWLGPDGGNLTQSSPRDIAAACMYLTAKISGDPKSPRSIINVFSYLESLPTFDFNGNALDQKALESYYVSESRMNGERETLFENEAVVLRTVGFSLHVALPHALFVSYLQALEIFQHPKGTAMAANGFKLLNDALLGPQLLYLTHQPNELATAAVYLAARETGVKLPNVEFYEAFDCDREELGFIVVGMLSARDFAERMKGQLALGKIPTAFGGIHELVVEDGGIELAASEP